MRLVVQRVKKAKVTLSSSGEVAGSIGNGLLVLFGVGKEDSKKDVEVLINKLIKLRVMADENGKMNLSVGDMGGEILVISQFTLYADTSAGNRPSFFDAAEPDKAQDLYEYFIARLREMKAKVKTGKFGENMKIDAILDGPVTILY